MKAKENHINTHLHVNISIIDYDKNRLMLDIWKPHLFGRLDLGTK